MLWYKSWLETRWRFLIGLALLICSAAAAVLTYPRVVELLRMMPAVEVGGVLGRRINEAVNLAREYHGYIWSQWFHQNLMQGWTIFAVLLGTGGLLSQASGGGALYTLSLPASRTRLLAVRAATGLAELLALAVVPSLLIPLLSPGVGQTYGVRDALVYSACLFTAGSVFFSLASLLSTVFSDVWRPLLIALFVAVLLVFAEQIVDGLSRYSLFGVMSGERYFHGGGLPWAGLLLNLALSAAMLYGAALNLARRDF
jgi:hypothetical protein